MRASAWYLFESFRCDFLFREGRNWSFITVKAFFGRGSRYWVRNSFRVVRRKVWGEINSIIQASVNFLPFWGLFEHFRISVNKMKVLTLFLKKSLESSSSLFLYWLSIFLWRRKMVKNFLLPVPQISHLQQMMP